MAVVAICGCGDLIRRPRRGGKRDGEGRPGWPGADVDVALVCVDDASDDGESEPRTGVCACGGGAVEAFEDVGEVISVDAGSVIGDGYVPVLHGYPHRL